MLNHTVDVKRPVPRWTPIELMSSLGRPESGLLQHIACLKQEIADLRDYCERVTKELRTLQLQQSANSSRKLGENYGETVDALAGAQESTVHGKGLEAACELPLPAWALNMQLMCPLLSTYDERIKEQQLLLERRENDLKALADSVIELTKENETLTRELRAKHSQLHALFLVEGQDGGPGSTVSAVLQEKKELGDLYNVTKEQNKVLLDQNHLMKCHIQQAEQRMEELQAQIRSAEQQKAAALDMNKQTESIQLLLQETQQLLEEAVEERDVLRNHLQQTESELLPLRDVCTELQSKVATLEHQVEEERAAVRDLVERASGSDA